jgi:hypothetical protein
MYFFRSIILFTISLIISGLAQNYQPAMDYRAMMNIRFYEQTGGFLIETLPIFFPPQDMNSVAFEIIDANGKSKLKSGVYVNKWQKFPIVDGIRPKGSAGNVKLGQAGNYILRVTVAGKEITRIPFKMAVQNSGDPFNPKSTFTRQGPWSKLGFISVNPERPDDAISFNWWANTGEMPGGKGGKMTAHILKSGNEIAESRGFFISKINWQACNKPFKQAGTNFRNFFTLANLTANDGTYEIILKAGDKIIRTYTATVSGGKINHHPRSAMDYTPHAEYIVPKIIFNNTGSGSNNKMFDAYWVESK